MNQKILAKLLLDASCSDSDCDGFGTRAIQISDDEWEPQQCEWCHMRADLLNRKDLLKRSKDIHFKQEIF